LDEGRSHPKNKIDTDMQTVLLHVIML